MKKKHFDCFVTSLHGNVYAVGGYDYERKLLSSGEMFDPITNKWSAILDMKKDWLCCAACVIGDYDDGIVYLSSVEVFDTIT